MNTIKKMGINVNRNNGAATLQFGWFDYHRFVRSIQVPSAYASLNDQPLPEGKRKGLVQEYLP